MYKKTFRNHPTKTRFCLPEAYIEKKTKNKKCPSILRPKNKINKKSNKKKLFFFFFFHGLSATTQAVQWIFLSRTRPSAEHVCRGGGLEGKEKTELCFSFSCCFSDVPRFCRVFLRLFSEFLEFSRDFHFCSKVHF